MPKKKTTAQFLKFHGIRKIELTEEGYIITFKDGELLISHDETYKVHKELL